MGNEIERCCRHCMKLQGDQFSLQTRFLEIEGNFKKPLKCRKYYISSEPLQKQKINQLLIFTDSSLSMTIPNFTLKLKDEDLQKLEDAVKYEIYNNNLVIKQNCFVLNAIEQEIDSQYDQFKEFPSKSSLLQQHPPLQNSPIQNQILTKEKLRNEIQQFTLRNKSRAFRFKNPLKNYHIGQIIIAIVPIFEKPTDLNILKQAVQQGLSMSEDMKSVGVSQISFVLGYDQKIFQKMIIQYVLGYSKARKEYVFKRMNDFVYLTRSNEQINNFFNFLKVYTKSNLSKNQSLQTLGTEKEKNNIRRLGANFFKKTNPPPVQQTKITVSKEDVRNKQKKNTSLSDLALDLTSPLNQNLRESSFGNTSYLSYNSGGNKLLGFDRQKAFNNSQPNINLSRRSFNNHDFGLSLNEISEINSGNSETSEIKNIRIKSFKSKESNVSDYF